MPPSIKSVLICGWYVIVCLSLGCLLLRLLACKQVGGGSRSAVVRAATGFLLGQGVLADLWLILGLCGKFSPNLVFFYTIVFTAGGIAFAFPVMRGVMSELRGLAIRFASASVVWKVLSALTIIQLLVLFAGAFLPPAGDALIYYMTLPKVMSHYGQLAPLAGFEVFMQMGHFGEMHYAALMSLGSAPAAKLLIWPNCLCAVVFLSALAGRAGLAARGKLICIVMLLTSTAVTYIAVDGKVDLFAAAMGLGAFYWAFASASTDGKGTVRASGLLTGFAVVAKLSFLVSVLPPIALLIFWRAWLRRRDEGGKTSGSITAAIARWSVWMLLPIGVHVAKNWVMFDAPLAPFVGTGANLNRVIEAGADVTWRFILLRPLLPFFARLHMYGNISVLVLAFLPLVLLIPRKKIFNVRSGIFQLTCCAAVGLGLHAIILSQQYQCRLYMPSILLLAIPAAAGAEYVLKMERRPRILSACIVAGLFLAITTILAYESPMAVKAGKCIAGITSHHDAADPSIETAQFVNANANQQDRVFINSEFRYYLRPDILRNTCDRKEMVELLGMKNAGGARWRWLYSKGFRYLIVDKPYLSRGKGRIAVSAGLQCLAGSLDMKKIPTDLKLTLIYEGPQQIVFRLMGVNKKVQKK